MTDAPARPRPKRKPRPDPSGTTAPAEVPPTVIIVPVLMRPQRVRPLLASIEAATPEPHRVLFVANLGDDAELAELRACGADHLVMPYPHHPRRWATRPGEWARKINAAYAATDEPLLFLAADDLVFHPGWLTAAQRQLRPGVGVVGTNDLHNRRVIAGLHATHMLVTRAYVDRHGTIDELWKVLNETYPHEYADDELVETAKFRGAWAFAADAHVEHLHPLWGTAPDDDLYREHKARMAVGRAVFKKRRKLWSR